LGGAVLDFLFMVLYGLLLWGLTKILQSGSVFIEDLVFTVFLTPLFFYHPLLEYFFNGQTVGKMLLKLKVIRIDGSSASLSDIILRWIIRFVDVNLGMILIIFMGSLDNSDQLYGFFLLSMIMPMPIVGMISIMKTKYGQRLGDLAANTVVVSMKRTFSLEDTILSKTSEEYVPKYPQVIELNDSDIRTIKSVLKLAKKRKGMENIQRLADKAKERLKIDSKEESTVFLDVLIKDYNHLAVEKDENPFSK